MTLTNLIRGLTILQECNLVDNYNVGAEHDTIYVYPTDGPLHITKLKELICLGWSQEHWEGDEDGWIVEYDPKESWVAYV